MAKTPGFKIARTIPEMIADARRPKIKADTAWYKVGISEFQGVGFTNSWLNVGFLAGITHAPTGWYLSENGEVRLRGVVDGGLPGTVIFNLPEEVRPEYAQTFVCATIGGGTANIRVEPDGDVLLEA